MLIKIFSLSFNSVTGKFEDSELEEFMKQHEVLSINDYLFVKDEVPYLTLIVKYQSVHKESKPENKGQSKYDESWKELLTEADMGLFNIIRDWRTKRSKKEGVPPYILLTNKQLAELVKKRPQNKSELITVDGIGKAKADKYGDEILEITKISEVKDGD